METTNQNQEEKNNDGIKLYTIHSTRISKAGWYFDEATKQGVLILEFPPKKEGGQGTQYMYYPVANQVFSDMFKAKSKGQYLEQHIIKNKDVKYIKIGQPKMDM